MIFYKLIYHINAFFAMVFMKLFYFIGGGSLKSVRMLPSEKEFQ